MNSIIDATSILPPLAVLMSETVFCCVTYVLFCHKALGLKQDLQSAECGGAFKAKAVLKSADLCTLYQFTHLDSDSNFHMWTWIGS